MQRARLITAGLALLAAGCGGGGEQGPLGPTTTAALPDLAGTWTISTTWTRGSGRCDYVGLLSVDAGTSTAQGDLRHTGTCAASTRDADMDRVRITIARTTAGDSIQFTFVGSPTKDATCRYVNPVSGSAPTSLVGLVSCSNGWLGQWTASRGAPVPPPVPSLHSISAGNFSTCALAADGRAFCWGVNAYGELGTGDALPRITPTAVLDGFRWAQISVSPAGAFTCGLTLSGAAYCWGNAGGARLGGGTSGPLYSTAFVPVPVAGGHTFTQIATGGDHVCALDAEGTVYCWGYNSTGQLGTGDRTASATPRAVSGGRRFIDISAHVLTSCAVETTGAAYCWGRGTSGELGNGTMANSNVPVAVSGTLTFRSIALGMWFACGVTSARDGYCWGSHGAGELGAGATGSPLHTTPVKVAGGIEWARISGGFNLACGVAVSGRGYCWGGNTSGERGDGTADTGIRDTPTPIAGNIVVADISADWHACAISREGAAYCWGPGPYGSLGDGTLQDRNVPTRIASQQ